MQNATEKKNNILISVGGLTDLESLFLLLHENHQRPPFLGIFSFMMLSTDAWRQACTYNSKLTENVTKDEHTGSKQQP